MNHAWVYILTNDRRTTLYIGSTAEIRKRIKIHRNKSLKGFTQRYNLFRLVYLERHSSIDIATTRERYLKGKRREMKEALIAKINPDWHDLYYELERIKETL